MIQSDLMAMSDAEPPVRTIAGARGIAAQLGIADPKSDEETLRVVAMLLFHQLRVPRIGRAISAEVTVPNIKHWRRPSVCYTASV